MRFLFRLILFVVIIGAVAAVAVPMLVPADYMRDQITQVVKQQTGRDLTVAGETSFSIVPDIGVRLGQVALSDPPKMSKGTTLTMDALTVNLRLLPLLSRQIEVKQFVLERPVFDLRVDKNGLQNWDFAQVTPVEPARRVVQAQAGGLAGAQLQNLRLGDVRIMDGTVKYRDERTSTALQVDAINVTLILPAIDEQLEAKGTFDWQKEQVAINGSLDSPQSLLANKATPANVSLTSSHMTGTFKGEIELGEVPRAKGTLNGSSPSLRNLAAWLGNPVPTQGGFGTAALESVLTATPQAISLSPMELAMDGMKGNGNAQLRLSGAKPHLRLKLALDKLDLNVFFQPAPIDVRATPRPASAPQGAGQQDDGGTQPDQSLGDFIDQLNQQDEGRAKKSAPLVRGWSQRAFDFSGLKLIDADADLTTNALFYKRIRVGKSVVKAILKSGQLNADLNELQLYGGQGRGRLTIYGDRAVPALGAAFNIAGVSALPIMTDALAFDWISGKANFTVAISGAGRSESEMVRSLQGNGTVRFTDGAIEGLNIPQMIRSVSLGQIQGTQRSSRLKTDFSELSGTYTIQNGIISNSDLQLVGPLLRAGGKGIVDLPREVIDYSLEPRLVASLQGQGGDTDMTGVVVPIKIKGPLDNPRIQPDIEAILRSPEAAAKQIGEVVKNLKANKKNLGGVLDNLLGKRGGGGQQTTGQAAGEASGQAATEQPAQKTKPEDLLNQIFR